jgi:hypothetical protein
MLKFKGNGMKQKGKEAERRRTVVKPKSPYTLAHSVLLSAQSQNGNKLNVRQVQDQLERSPEIVFPPGTTVNEILRNLEKWEFLKIEGEHVRVVAKP